MDQHTPPAEGSNVISMPGTLTRVDPNKKVSDADWEVIKALYCAGAKATELAPRWGIKPGTINTKASKEKWPSPLRVAQAAKNPIAESDDPAQALAALWTERGEQSRESTYNGAKKALDRFWALAPVPTSFQEAAIANKMLKEAIEPEGPKDSQANSHQVNIAVLTNSGFTPKPAVDV